MDDGCLVEQQIRMQRGYQTAELSLSSNDYLLGIKGMLNKKFRNFWLQCGAETFFSPVKMSGGVGILFNLSTITDTLSFVTNPIIGYFRCCYIKDWNFGQELIRMATKYEYNIHSIESDISWALQYKMEATSFKLRYSIEKGIGLFVKMSLSDILLRIGLAYDLRSMNQSFGIQISNTQ